MEMLNKSKLHFVDFAFWTSRISLNPETHMRDRHILEIIKKKNSTTKAAIGDLIVGHITRYDIYASCLPQAEASFDDLENIPYWYGNTKRLQKMFQDAIRFSEVEEFNFAPNIRSHLYPEGTRIKHLLNWPLTKYTKFFYSQVFLAEEKTIGQLVEESMDNFGWDRVEAMEGLRKGFLAAKVSGQMLLRHRSVPRPGNAQVKAKVIYEVYDRQWQG